MKEPCAYCLWRGTGKNYERYHGKCHSARDDSGASKDHVCRRCNIAFYNEEGALTRHPENDKPNCPIDEHGRLNIDFVMHNGITIRRTHLDRLTSSANTAQEQSSAASVAPTSEPRDEFRPRARSRTATPPVNAQRDDYYDPVTDKWKKKQYA